MKQVIEVTRPNVVMCLGEAARNVPGMGPFMCHLLESVPVKGVSCPTYFSPFSVAKAVSLNEIKLVSCNDGRVVGPEVLRDGAVLGVLYPRSEDPYLVKFFVCVISCGSEYAKFLYPSEGAAGAGDTCFVVTEVMLH